MNLLQDTFNRVSGDLDLALGTEDLSDLCVEESQVVIDFGGCPHRGTGILDGIFLLNGDGRGNSVDGLHVGPVHLLQELSRIRGERLDVASLPFGEKGIEGQASICRTRKHP